jgi:hypothetical protein
VLYPLEPIVQIIASENPNESSSGNPSGIFSGLLYYPWYYSFL